jgi:hypothetical protein
MVVLIALFGLLIGSFTAPPVQAAAEDGPESTVRAYYLAVAGRDYHAAYDLLAPSMLSGQSYADFEQSFVGLLDLKVDGTEVVREETASAVVRVEISTLDQVSGAGRFGGSWLLERIEGAWRLAGSYMAPL